MTSLKKMTGTDAFLDLPENIKGCQIEDQDKCYSRRYIEELQNQCKCLPWALGAIVPQKVFNPVVCVNQCEIFQNTSFCNPNANSCTERVSERHSNCKISCSGLYAVVWYLGDEQNDKEGKSGQKLAQMTSAYHRYLNNYAENIVFNSSSEDLSECLSENICSLFLLFSPFQLLQKISPRCTWSRSSLCLPTTIRSRETES